MEDPAAVAGGGGEEEDEDDAPAAQGGDQRLKVGSMHRCECLFSSFK